MLQQKGRRQLPASCDFSMPQYHDDIVPQPNLVSDNSAAEQAKLAKEKRDALKKSKIDRKNKVLASLYKPQSHADLDTKETLVVAQPNLLSGNSASKDRAQLEYAKSQSDPKNNLSKMPQYIDDLDTKNTLIVAQPNLFNGNSATKERAHLARQRRDEVDKSKRDRKNKILDSLDFLEDSESSDFKVDDKLYEKKSRQSLLLLRSSSKSSSKSSSTDTPSSSPSKPQATPKIQTPLLPSTTQATPKSRLPYYYRKNEDNMQLDGKIVPSDQAFSDMILEDGRTLPEGSVWADFIAVESLTDKVSDESHSSFSYVYTHTMRYNGETIWILETRSNCDKRGTWGQSSTCTLSHRDGLIRVNINYKGRRSLGQGWNTREKRELKLADLIRQSGEARQKELMCQ
jgi:hypothetical protein